MVAGINATRAVSAATPFILDRADGYIGVLIDDLVTLGTREPYRMFTSRAEYRLTLRADNADQRLTPTGIEIGCVGAARAKSFRAKHERLDAARRTIRGLALTPAELAKRGVTVNHDGVARNAFELLGRPDMSVQRLAGVWPELNGIEPGIAEQLEIEARYRGYLERQEADIRAFRRDEALALPASLDYDSVGSLSAEVRQKLKTARPATLGAAGRISGVTPAALVALLRHVRKSPGARSAA
ncbi:MAG: hypothetical protein U1F37_15895 [Alphaproteobacteria bacterium]